MHIYRAHSMFLGSKEPKNRGVSMPVQGTFQVRILLLWQTVHWYSRRMRRLETIHDKEARIQIVEIKVLVILFRQSCLTITKSIDVIVHGRMYSNRLIGQFHSCLNNRPDIVLFWCCDDSCYHGKIVWIWTRSLLIGSCFECLDGSTAALDKLAWVQAETIHYAFVWNGGRCFYALRKLSSLWYFFNSIYVATENGDTEKHWRGESKI